MTERPDILCPDVLCIGAMLWDVIGRAPRRMAPGADVPGRIRHIPGGVALNVAVALARWGLEPGQAVFIDDNAANVAAARDLGIDGIRFTDPAALAAWGGTLLVASHDRWLIEHWWGRRLHLR